MKRIVLLIFVLSITCFSSCKKKDDPAPNTGSSGSGTTVTNSSIQVNVSFSPAYTYRPGSNCTGSFLHFGYVRVYLYPSTAVEGDEPLVNKTCGPNSSVDLGEFPNGDYYVEIFGREEATNYCTNDTYTFRTISRTYNVTLSGNQVVNASASL